MRCIFLLGSLSLLSAQVIRRPQPSSGSAGFNLDFENSFEGAPALWGFVNGNTSEYQEGLDTTVFYSGSQSLRIGSVAAPSSDKAYAYQDIPSSLIRGRTLHFSGAIRTSQVGNGFATRFVQVNEPTTAAVFNLQPNAPSGTTGWQVYDLSATVPADTTDILFGVTLHGSGTAWFDQLSLDVNGVPVSLPIGYPTPAQIAWLQQNATPLTTLQPAVNDAELDPLKGAIGTTRIVGLGEGTHGTSEFFQMKSRVVSYLARNLGFTIFAIEANMPEAYEMNDYVLNGNGDPKQLLTAMYFWTWNTQEVLDMVTWMRQFNQSGQGQIQFLGFDMQYAQVAMSNVAAFVERADPGLMSDVASNYAVVGLAANQPFGQATPTQVANAIGAANAVWQQLGANRNRYVQQQSAADVDWAIQNAQIVLQAVTELSSGSGAYRDSQMALNVEWIASQNPNARIVLWAHDYHISRQPGSMGGALAQYFGSDYVTIGQYFHAGSYNAVNSTGLGPNVAEPGFALDSQLTKEFDAIIFFDQTNPSVRCTHSVAAQCNRWRPLFSGPGFDLLPWANLDRNRRIAASRSHAAARGHFVRYTYARRSVHFHVTAAEGSSKTTAPLQISVP